ncbi:MAG: hypothetical protein HY673_01120 [Chloroflexi bacterium]|nr:hypothetical protein [Chloroflexota bacterium]
MPSNPRENITLNWVTIQLIERFANVLYPLDPVDLLLRLPNLGYVVAERVALGAPLEAGKPLAVKGDVELILNQDNKILGVRGRTAESVLKEFESLRQFYTDELDPSPSIRTDYVEIHGNGWVRGQRNPLEVFAGWRKEIGKVEAMGKVLGRDVTVFGISLCPPDVDPNSPDWFDIRIEPFPVSSGRRYRVTVVWRQQEMDEVLSRFKVIDDNVKDIILRIEKP